MTIYCTYCSAKKHRDSIPIPAIERYRSDRISKCFDKAKSSGIPFVILSGKFGLLNPFDQIPYYDHLLKKPDIKEHADLVANQLKLLHVSKLYFFTASEKSDPNSIPYLECIRSACSKNGIKLMIMEEAYYD